MTEPRLAMFLSATLLLFLLVLFGALQELYRDVRQIKSFIGLLDQAVELNMASGAGGSLPSALGLPEALDMADQAFVLFLSERCGTCRSIAVGLEGRLPDQLWIQLSVGSRDGAVALCEATGLDRVLHTERLAIDVAGRVLDVLGIDSVPCLCTVVAGRLVSAHTVPSLRRLYTLMSDADPLLRKEPHNELG